MNIYCKYQRYLLCMKDSKRHQRRFQKQRKTNDPFESSLVHHTNRTPILGEKHIEIKALNFTSTSTAYIHRLRIDRGICFSQPNLAGIGHIHHIQLRRQKNYQLENTYTYMIAYAYNIFFLINLFLNSSIPSLLSSVVTDICIDRAPEIISLDCNE